MPEPFGFDLKESSVLARKMYQALDVDTSGWSRLDQHWRIAKVRLGELLGPTWRFTKTISIADDGRPRSERLRDATDSAFCQAADPEQRLESKVSVSDFSEADARAEKVCPDSPLLDVPEVKVGMRLSKALVLLLAHKTQLPRKAPPWRPPQLREACAESVVAQAWERYKGGTKGTLVLSVNILDLLMVSENVSFASCHRFEGEYRAGPLQYLMDDHTAVLYLTSENRADKWVGAHLPYKTWRQMVHISLDKKAAVFMRQYGTILLDETHKPIRRVVAELIARANGLPCDNPAWTKKLYTPEIETDLAYIDPCYAYICLDEAKWDPELCRATCPSCGSFMTKWEHNSLVCVECAGPSQTCDCCGDGVDDEAVRYGDGVLCQSCYEDRYFSCYRCGEVYHEDNCRSPEGSSTVYCDDCADQYLTQCDRCECHFVARSESFTSVGDETWCEDCTDTHASHCDCCETYVSGSVTETQDGDACDDCLEGYERCPECEENFSVTETICVHCPNCAQKAEESHEQVA